MTEIIRTARNGCFQVRSNAWGSFLAPCSDPDSNVELEKGALDRFELHPNIQRIPCSLWNRWVQLCFHFAHLRQGDLEVSCRLLRREDDRSLWRILVPRQEVTGASVRIDSFDEAIDIETGELIEQYPPAGWVPAGSSHSHNTMTLDRFSSTDDASELSCPGLHIVVSHIDTTARRYKPTASVTANKRRFYLPDAAAVIDLTPTEDSFHPAVLEVVRPERPRTASPWLSSHISSKADQWLSEEPMWDDLLPQGKRPSEAGVCPCCGNPSKLVDLSSRAQTVTVEYACTYCTHTWIKEHPQPPRWDEPAVSSDVVQEERELLLQSLYELASDLRDLANHYDLDANALLKEATDALIFTFNPDDPIHWTHEPDQSVSSTIGHHSPASQ